MKRKHKCKFFDRCNFADEKSRTCTENGGGNYCGIYRMLMELKEEKEK